MCVLLILRGKLMLRFLSLCICLLLACGCSTQKNEPDANVASDSVVAEDAGTSQASVVLPFEIGINEVETDADGVVTLEVQVDTKSVMQATPVLVLEAGENDTLVDTPVQMPLEDLRSQTTTVKKIRISGPHPSIVASVRLVGPGFGVEVHESWPNVAQMQRREIDTRTELPAPIEVEGQTITRGVEVKP